MNSRMSSQLPRPKKFIPPPPTHSTPIKTNQDELKENITNISNILNTNLSPEVLEICIKLLEVGVNPQGLAQIVQKIRKETGKD